MSDSHIDLTEVEDHIRSVIENYRREYGYMGGTGMDDRDVVNLTRRLSRAISDQMEEMDTYYIEHLQERIEELEEKARLANDPQFTELWKEYESMRALVKELVYRLGKEDSVTVVPNEQIQNKVDNVDLDVSVGEVSTKIEVTELN